MVLIGIIILLQNIAIYGVLDDIKNLLKSRWNYDRARDKEHS